MTKTRNIADLLDVNGDVVSGALDNVPASNDASALTTGTLPSARLGTITAFRSTGIDDNADATAITIDSSERVGVGNTSPINKLDVKASADNEDLIRLSHPSSPANAGALLGFNSDGTTDNNVITLGIHYSNDFYDVLNIQRSTRNVGIGTVNPLEQLDISSNVPRIRFTDLSVTNLRHVIGSEANDLEIRCDDGNVQATSHIGFKIDGSEKVRMTDTGRVGIGTTSPQNKLDITALTWDDGITIKTTGNTNVGIIGDANRSSAGGGLLNLQARWNGTEVAGILFQAGSDTTNKDDGEIVFRTASAGTPSEKMRIDGDGNVSIGTTSTLHNLHVQANGETTDSWFRNGHTISCSGSWQGGKQIQVDWDIQHSVSYAFEFITASYGARQHFVVGSYYAGSSHQTVMTNNGSSSMSQGGNSGGERWTSSGGTHGVYCCRITTAGGHHNALVTLI
tara:strand:- start:1743 stop:3098 length:1356 start_codon:yes stop_codon:yes gene_type:complete